MKKIFIFIALTLFLTSFIFAQASQIQAVSGVLTQAQIQEINQTQNRIRIQAQEDGCPENCTCTGSVVKCALEKGGRNMTITAGRSGNIIVQVKQVNMSTNVTVYKSEGKVYGEFKGETKEVRVMPDMVKDRVRERVARELEDEEIELDEEGIYKFRARKKVKLFGFIRTRVRVRAEINSETGELLRIRNSWWAFLASEEGEPIIGAGCGTVSPDNIDECCINKGYDLWNEETLECAFSD